MNRQHWMDVERLFHEALALPPQRRTQFLDDSCAGNDGLKHDVQSLLDESSADDFLERPALDPDATGFQAATSSLIGRRLSEYEITARIGAGGMGDVYRARDVKLGRDVAIKVPLRRWLTMAPVSPLHARGADPGGPESSPHRRHLRSRGE